MRVTPHALSLSVSKKRRENSNDKWGSLLNICRKTLFRHKRNEQKSGKTPSVSISFAHTIYSVYTLASRPFSSPLYPSPSPLPFLSFLCL